jgi:glycosyltransferase involved in cell wall biosynthesis
MKICLLSYRGNNYCGGQGIYIHYLSRELLNMGHEVHLMAGPPYPEVVDGIKVHKLESLKLYDGNGPLPSDPSRLLNPLNLYEFLAARLGTFPEPLTFSMRAYHKLREFSSQNKFDVIHDNQGLGYGLLLMKTRKVPIIATIHHPIPIDREVDLAHAKNLRRKLRLRVWYSFCAMQGRVSKRLDRVIAVSKSSEDEARHIFKVPQSKIRVVYNGLDASLFKRDDSIQREPNSIIMVGNAEGRVKGAIYLLKALQLLKGEMEVKLTIAGCAPDSEYVTNLVKKYQLEDIVTFTGKISMEELVRGYSTAQVAVAPSLYEGFGFPAAEAMSCKVPIVVTRAGALPEVVGEDGEAGIIVPPADHHALAAAIRQLLTDESLRRRMGEAGRSRVERHFTWAQAAKRTTEVYEELM